jgi:mgtE-like transporter
MATSRSDTAIPARAMLDKFIKTIPEPVRPDITLLRQAFFVLLICGIIDLFPGYFLGQFEVILEKVPGLLMILPPTVGLRGNIFGALAARLGSKLHLGTIQPKFKGNPELGKQLTAASIQLLFLSILIPLVAEISGSIFGLDVVDPQELIFISISAAVLSGILMFIITFGITFMAFKKGWDPDNVSAPIVASSGDILTIPVLLFCSWIVFSVPGLWTTLVSWIALGLIIMISTLFAFQGRGAAREILREALPIAMLAVIVSTFSGLVLGATFKGLLSGTIFLIMVPAFNGQGGSMGSVLGSRITSSAYLGQYRLSFRPNELALRSTISLWLISLVVFGTLGVGSLLLGWISGSDSPSVAQLMLILLIGSTMITLLTSAVAYYIAYVSFKMGLDPDNVVIPLLTASMDVVGTGSLIITLLVTGAVFG